MRIKPLIAIMLLSLAVPVLKAQTPSPTLGARLSMELTFPSGGNDYNRNDGRSIRQIPAGT